MSPFPENHPTPGDDDAVDIRELARLCGMRPDEILEFSRLHLVSLHPAEGGFRVDVRTLRRLRHISMLRDDHEMKPPAIGYVLDLMDRLEEAERELRSLRDRL